MTKFTRRALGLVSAASLVALTAGGAVAQDKRTIAVSIPAATHGWTGGVVYHAEQAEKEIEAAFPNIDVIVKTSPSATAQVSALEDLSAGQTLDALVILPFTSEELTGPVEQVKSNGTYIAVVDRGLTDPSIQDLYVAGDNIAVGANTAKWMAEKLGGEGKVVVLRGIPTVIVQGRHDCCTPPKAAWALHKAWPEAKLQIIPDGGHLFSEPGVLDGLISATDRFAG